MKEPTELDHEGLVRVAMERLRGFLAKTDPTSLEIGAARVAASTYASFTKLKQAEGAREALLVMTARELAEDKTKFRKYLSVSLPSTSSARRMLQA